MDQASSLKEKKRETRVIAVASGKGGVGKTNVVANLACVLAAAGRQVMILDADLGLANLDVLLGFAPQYNLSHVLSGEKNLADIVIEGPRGIKVIPASSGIQEVTRLAAREQRILLDQMGAFDGQFDYLFIDNTIPKIMNLSERKLISQFQKTLEPLIQIASNSGFQFWNNK